MLDDYWIGVISYNSEKICMIRDKDGKVIGIGTRSRGNVFQLNPIEMTCLVAKVDNSWLWHRKFCHINSDNSYIMTF